MDRGLVVLFRACFSALVTQKVVAFLEKRAGGGGQVREAGLGLFGVCSGYGSRTWVLGLSSGVGFWVMVLCGGGLCPPHGSRLGLSGLPEAPQFEAIIPLVTGQKGVAGGARIASASLSLLVAFMSQSWGRSPANRLSFCPSLVTYSWWEGEVRGAPSSVWEAGHLAGFWLVPGCPPTTAASGLAFNLGTT